MKAAGRISLLLVICSFLSLGIGGCSPTLEEVCRSQVPQLEKEISEARGQIIGELASLDPEFAKRQLGRSIASESRTDDDSMPRRLFELNAKEKESWQDWSTDRLKLIEKYMDLSRLYPELIGARPALSALAENFVDFEGYADNGELYQMNRSLQRAETDLEEASRVGCAKLQP